MNYRGESRPVVIGRLKVEVRPMIMVQLQGESSKASSGTFRDLPLLLAGYNLDHPFLTVPYQASIYIYVCIVPTQLLSHV